jgi:hypothetical protein
LYVRRGKEDSFVAREVRWSRIYFIFFATILLATPSAAQTSDQVLGAIKAIAASWQTVIQKQTLILAPCEIGTWHVIRLSSNSTVSFDVRKTDSLVSPYVGIIQISGTVEMNGMQDNPEGSYFPKVLSCFHTPEQGLADNEFKEPFGPREYIANYNFNDGRFVLSGGNEQFQNTILPALNASAQLASPSVAGLMGSSIGRRER